jgi:hypothetical protein
VTVLRGALVIAASTYTITVTGPDGTTKTAITHVLK